MRAGAAPVMTSTTLLTTARRLVLASVALAMLGVQPAAAQQQAPPTPGQGYPEVEGIPARPHTPDIEPVYRKPAIDTLATIRKRGVLRVGVAPTEPFVMRDKDGNLVGLSIDIGRKLAEDLGVEVTFVPTSWSQIIPDLVDNQSDLIASGLWVTPSRALVVNFTEPSAVEAVHLIASRQLAGSFKSKTDFDRADVTLVVYAGTIQEDVASRAFPKATLMKLEGDADPLAPVLDGKAHAALVTTPVPQAIVEQAGGRLVLPFAEALQSTNAAMAVRKGDPDFLNYLNGWLAYHRQGGWLGARTEYWNRPSNWMNRM